MRILLINKFLYPKGGDAISTLNTGKLLTAKGHKVIFWGMAHPSNPDYSYKDYFVSNVDFNKPTSLIRQIKAGLRIVYSLEAKRKIERLVKAEKPDIVHLNNFAHQISPSILDVFKKYKIPVVMTTHDYKLVCPIHFMLSNGKPCEKCKDGKYYQCLINICTKNSRLKSLLNTIEMYLHHKILHIYDLINISIAPSFFLKNKLDKMGFRGKIVLLPYFVQLKEYIPQYNWNNNSIVYFGRLSSEKGILTLIEAVKGLDITVKVIGEGPMKEILESKIESNKYNNINFLGYRKGESLKNEIGKSMFTISPSEWYENYPFSIIEAFSLGKPVIASRIGGIPELVKDERTGLMFEPGNSGDLRRKIEYLINKPDKIREMGQDARTFVEKELNAEKHYLRLIEIYERAIESKKLQVSGNKSHVSG